MLSVRSLTYVLRTSSNIRKTGVCKLQERALNVGFVSRKTNLMREL